MFADKSHPIRCSKLANIAKCSARIYMIHLIDNEDDEGGESAQTGSLTHAGVAAFHKTKGNLSMRKGAAWDAIAKAAKEFPLADKDEVRLFITPYMDDPRNINAVMLAVEHEVEFTLDPHELDPTGEKIYIEGTLDQIRKWPHIRYPVVDDLKTGKKTGWEMIHDYALQLAAYAYAARQCGFPDVGPGHIIRNYGYRVRGAEMPAPSGVFWAMPYKWDDIPSLLDTVKLGVALIRMGYYHFNPGPHCTYCEFGGLTGCKDQERKLIKLGRL